MRNDSILDIRIKGEQLVLPVSSPHGIKRCDPAPSWLHREDEAACPFGAVSHAEEDVEEEELCPDRDGLSWVRVWREGVLLRVDEGEGTGRGVSRAV